MNNEKLVKIFIVFFTVVVLLALAILRVRGNATAGAETVEDFSPGWQCTRKAACFQIRPEPCPGGEAEITDWIPLTDRAEDVVNLCPDHPVLLLENKCAVAEDITASDYFQIIASNASVSQTDQLFRLTRPNVTRLAPSAAAAATSVQDTEWALSAVLSRVQESLSGLFFFSDPESRDGGGDIQEDRVAAAAVEAQAAALGTVGGIVYRVSFDGLLGHPCQTKIRARVHTSLVQCAANRYTALLARSSSGRAKHPLNRTLASGLLVGFQGSEGERHRRCEGVTKLSSVHSPIASWSTAGPRVLLRPDVLRFRNGYWAEASVGDQQYVGQQCETSYLLLSSVNALGRNANSSSLVSTVLVNNSLHWNRGRVLQPVFCRSTALVCLLRRRVHFLFVGDESTRDLYTEMQSILTADTIRLKQNGTGTDNGDVFGRAKLGSSAGFVLAPQAGDPMLTVLDKLQTSEWPGPTVVVLGFGLDVIIDWSWKQYESAVEALCARAVAARTNQPWLEFIWVPVGLRLSSANGPLFRPRVEHWASRSAEIAVAHGIAVLDPWHPRASLPEAQSSDSLVVKTLTNLLLNSVCSPD